MLPKKSGKDTKDHTIKLKVDLKRLSQHLREEIEKVDEPQAKALFEVSAEVIDGLVKAFSDYEEKNEKAWIE